MYSLMKRDPNFTAQRKLLLNKHVLYTELFEWYINETVLTTR